MQKMKWPTVATGYRNNMSLILGIAARIRFDDKGLLAIQQMIKQNALRDMSRIVSNPDGDLGNEEAEVVKAICKIVCAMVDSWMAWSVMGAPIHCHSCDGECTGRFYVGPNVKITCQLCHDVIQVECYAS